ncbi:unnamed protein product [Euphydryas editha]|uniref:Uncharacterized protein n=1 Tax=Euphydryas editha TaxID=104508 RepID=A0AAU9U626_EUPED|nr:unnamed protein product [Euphydryas editha]
MRRDKTNLYNKYDFTEYHTTLINKMEIKDYRKHLDNKSKLSIVAKITYIKEKLKLNGNTTEFENIAIKNYTSIKNKYFENLHQDKSEINDLDKELTILDLIITSSKIIHDISENILKTITQAVNIDREKTNIIKDEFYKQFVVDKKEEFEYVCQTLDVCRRFPAYTDFISDVIKEILNLPNSKINYAVKGLTVLIKEKANILREILGNKLFKLINDKLEAILHDISRVRYFLSTIDKTLNYKYKLAASYSKNKIRSKAIVILIDIIDKTFENDDNEILGIYFNNILKSLQKQHLIEDDIQLLIEDIVRHFVDELKFNWKPYVKEEVRTLAEVILKGKATNDNIYKYLFSKGSKYVRGEFDIDL